MNYICDIRNKLKNFSIFFSLNKLSFFHYEKFAYYGIAYYILNSIFLFIKYDVQNTKYFGWCNEFFWP